MPAKQILDTDFESCQDKIQRIIGARTLAAASQTGLFSTINRMIDSLQVEVVGLSECLISRDFELDLNGCDTPSFHYILDGHGWVHMRNQKPIRIGPHTLVVVPPKCSFRLDASPLQKSSNSVIKNHGQSPPLDTTMAGDTSGDIHLKEVSATFVMCCIFRSTYGGSVELFDMLVTPIVEAFQEDDGIGEKLKRALRELIEQEVCAEAMVATSVKQIIVELIRRSVLSARDWTKRFAMLDTPQIAEAFSEMVANPGKNHTIYSLSESACLSRSAFMARFTHAVGKPPMLVLHELRMREAAHQLAATNATISQITRNARYSNPSSFARAFKRYHGIDPTEYRRRSIDRGGSGQVSGGAEISERGIAID